MIYQLKTKKPELHITHSSEVLALRKQVKMMQLQIEELKHRQIDSEKQEATRGKIAIPTEDGCILVPVDSILFCQAHGNYSKVHTLKENYLLSKTLKSVSALLAPYRFFRCHQSFLVNTKHIKSLSKLEGLHLELSDGRSIPVSRRNKKMAMEFLAH